MPLLRKSSLTEYSKTPFNSTESLITTLGILSALMLSFTTPLFVNYDYNGFDRSNFREMYYAWPNSDFVNFVAFSLENTSPPYNMTVQIQEDTYINIKKVLMAPLVACANSNSNTAEKECDDQFRGNLQDMDSPLIEAALELAYANFPTDRLRAFINMNKDKFDSNVTRSIRFYQLVPMATIFLLMSLSGSVFLTVSLAFSDTEIKEKADLGENEKSLKNLETFNRFGIPLILVFYVFLIIGCLLFLTALGSLCSVVDMSVYKMEKFYASASYTAVAIMAGVLVYTAILSRLASNTGLECCGTNCEEIEGCKPFCAILKSSNDECLECKCDVCCLKCVEYSKNGGDMQEVGHGAGVHTNQPRGDPQLLELTGPPQTNHPRKLHPQSLKLEGLTGPKGTDVGTDM